MSSRGTQPAGERRTPPSLALRTAQGAGWVIVWRMATRVLGLINTLILVRLLLPADFGLVALATSFAQAVDWISTVGVEQALIRETHLDNALYNTGFTMNVIRAVAVGAMIAASAGPVSAFYGDARLMPILLAVALAMLLSGLENVRIVDFQRDLAFNKRFQMLLLPRVAGIVGSIVYALVYRDYWALVVGILVTRGSRMVLTYVMRPCRPRVTLISWRRIVGFSFWVWATAMLSIVRDRADALVIGRVLGAGSVGIYSVGGEIGSLTSTELVEPLTFALFAGFSAARRGGGDVAKGYFRAISIAFLLTMPLGFGLSLLAAPFVQLTLGPRWVSAVPLVQIFALLGMARVIAYFSSVLFNAHAMLTVQFRIMIVSTVVRLGVLVALIRPFGLMGAATAAIACIAIEEILFLVVTFRHFRLSPIDLLASVWRCMLAAAAMAAVLVWEGVGWVPAAASTAGLLRALAVGVTSGAATYTIVLLVAWWAVGRPRGAEAYMLDMLQQLVRPLGQRWGVIR
jgi:lipopolysaccharide exporter